jgi:glycosyltransferase involved in cell wall biosynthesis
VPFAHWIVASQRPRLLVELGSHAGVSYSAFCEAVLQGALNTRCFAVDTWEGDEHAGFYGNDIYADLKAFHDARYAGFSEMLRCRFDEALAYFEDGTVDLLHIDGRHHYDDVRQDFDTWRPKLSSRAVVLFHDTNVRERDFGVWRLWSELRREAPGFEFWHAHGLGVLAFGADVQEPVRSLCTLEDPAAIATIRERFALLGERWVADFDLDRTERQAHENAARAEEIQAVVNRQHAQLTEMWPLASSQRAMRVELAAARLDRMKAEHDAAAHLAAAQKAIADARQADSAAFLAERARADAAEQRAQDLLHEREQLRRSFSWRVTWPLRYVRRLMIANKPAPSIPPPVIEPVAPALTAPPPRRPKVLFVSGEWKTPGNLYRCIHLAALAQEQGWDATWLPLSETGAPPLIGCDLVVLWRAEYSDHVQGIIDYVHKHGGRVAFDIDDLVFKPDMANREMLDSVRIGTFSENGALALFRRFQETLQRCDLCLCTTEEIAQHLRRTEKPTWIVPNGFDEAGLRAARLARRAVRVAGPTDLIRIGYPAGSRTHQKDFAVAAPALAAVLRARPQVRLVLFQDPTSSEGVILLREFPEFAALKEQIEWRDMVPPAALPAELARYDINIAPLEAGNPFCEAKSELKFFEAALADVPTVASPSGPFMRAIRDGETGFLAADAAQWEEIILRLVDDAALRQRVGRNAYHDVLWQFGPRRRGELLAGFLAQAKADSAQAAEAFERDIRRGPYSARGLPNPVEAEILFESDQLRDAEVTVTIASYNYSAHVIEALDSVRLQTLDPLDLVVVDDVSPDDSVEVILQWAQTHAHRFNRLIVLRHRANAGLGASRNSGFNAAETPFVLPLDSDNRLRPTCCATLLDVIRRTRAAYAYPQLQHFGASDKVTGGERFEPRRLIGGNYIDAMALVAKWAWAAAGGYYQDRSALGWEDFDLWCSLVELGQWGEPVTEVLAEYRVHAGSMVNAITETTQTKRRVVETVEQRHNWLQVTGRAPFQR